MKAYKGFTKDMKCRDFQFAEGETYHEDTAKLCEHGFHACEDPIGCFGYYSPADSVYHEVELDDVSDERDDDSKVVAKTIKIGSEVSLFGIAKAHVDYVISKVKDDKKKAAYKTDYRSAATNTGNQSAATNTGNQSAATNTGDWSAATNTGNWSAAEVSGKSSVAIVTGEESKVKGAVGCAIVCVERGEWNGETYPIKAICAAIVDDEKIKADTWYTVKDGEFVEVEG